MDIEKMTDQQIIDYLRKNKSSVRAVSSARARSIESFFEEHDIVVRCPVCGSPHKKSNGTNSNGLPRFVCSACSKSYGLTANTIFEGTSYSLDEVIRIVHAILNLQPTTYLEANTSTTKKVHNSAVWLMTRKIINILAALHTPMLSGIVQVDEKYIRESQKGSKGLVSFLDGSTRRARRHTYRSECGVFGPEFINVLCAVDNAGHYWAKCVCLGPMGMDELEELRRKMVNVAYLCSDNYELYKDWCEQEHFKHYIEPSTYRKERIARGYVDTDNIYRPLSSADYAKDDSINRQLYKEGRYPHIENTDHEISYDEYLAIRNKFELGLNRVNSFHSLLDNYLIENCRNVSSNYLQDYVMFYAWMMNYKTSHHIRAFSLQDAEEVLALMCKETIRQKHSPTLADIKAMNTDGYARPSKRSITMARRQMKSARKVIKVGLKDKSDRSAYEGDDDSVQYMFNKEKFFRDIGTIRLNELAKLYGVYERADGKTNRIKKMCALPNAQDIIFYEIFVSQYADLEQFQIAINQQPKKRGRGRPKKNS